MPTWILFYPFSCSAREFARHPLIVGYAYGYFRHTDLIKIGILLTIVEFVVLMFCVTFYWPLLNF